jgi:hypothetical protein
LWYIYSFLVTLPKAKVRYCGKCFFKDGYSLWKYFKRWVVLVTIYQKTKGYWWQHFESPRHLNFASWPESCMLWVWDIFARYLLKSLNLWKDRKEAEENLMFLSKSKFV